MLLFGWASLVQNGSDRRPGKNINVGWGLGAGVRKRFGPCTTSQSGCLVSSLVLFDDDDPSSFCSPWPGKSGMKYGRIILDEPEEDKYRKPEENVTPALLEDVAIRKAAVVFGIINMACSCYLSILFCAIENVGIEILFVDC